MVEHKDNSRSVETPEGYTGSIPEDMPVVNLTSGMISLFGFVNKSSWCVSVFDSNLTTDHEALTVWVNEFSQPTQLTEEQTGQLCSHWENRKSAMGRKEEKVKAAAAKAAAFTGLSIETLAMLPALRLRARASSLAALAPEGSRTRTDRQRSR